MLFGFARIKTFVQVPCVNARGFTKVGVAVFKLF